MLCFDIETKGLDKARHDITVVCTQDYLTGERKAYEFEQCRRSGGDVQALTDAMTRAFDEATSLCAYNGVRFDIPFLETLGVPPQTLVAWALKCTDLLEQFRLRRTGTCSLNQLAAANGVELKSSDGKAAIGMAERGEWEHLREYCAQDVAILCQMHARRFLVHPRSRELMDLKDFSHPSVYPQPCAAAASARCEPLQQMEARLGEKLDSIAQMCRSLPWAPPCETPYIA